MKRFILSGIVIASFVMFSLYYRVMGQSTITFTPPKFNGDDEESFIPPTAAPTLTPTPTNTPTVINTTPPANTPVPPANTPTPKPTSGYKDGTFAGDAADAFYGNIQVQVVMQNGRITDVQFLQYPNDRSNSIAINQYAMPILKSEAIQAQSAHVDIVSGATDSSQAFIQSLQTALNKAKS